MNQPLKSRKSCLFSEENCPSSVLEAANLLHIHSPSLQAGCRRHCVSGMCYTHTPCAQYLAKEINTWAPQECCSLSWVHGPRHISAVLPRQVKQTLSGWKSTVDLCEVFAGPIQRSSFGLGRAPLPPPCGTVFAHEGMNLSLQLPLQLNKIHTY